MRLRQRCALWWIALAAALADRLSKVAVAKLAHGRGALIPGLVNLRPVVNRGMAFSMLSGHFWLLTVFTALVIGGIVAFLMAKPDEDKLLRAGLWLIAGGGLGNLYDRLTLGSVIDFIKLDFVDFAIFNVADVCICVGAALVLLGAWRAEREKGRSHGAI